MTAFSLKTSYRNDLSLHDHYEKGDYTPPAPGDPLQNAYGIDVVRFAATHPDYEAIAVGFGLTATDSVLVASMPLDANGKTRPFVPRVNGQMYLKTTRESWVIQNAEENRFGHWVLGVTKATSNAGA